MADYTFEGKALHVDLKLVYNTEFNETLTYTDDQDVAIDLTGYTAVLEIRNLDTNVVVSTYAETDPELTLGDAAGTIGILFTVADIAVLENPCYEWDIIFNGNYRFLKGYIYTGDLL